jgi:Fic family protein
LKAVLDKARFWDRIKDVPLTDRQRSVINRLLDGFEGKLTSSKYAKLAKCSQDTAHRDILELVDRGVLVRNPEGGRSTSYSLAPAK